MREATAAAVPKDMQMKKGKTRFQLTEEEAQKYLTYEAHRPELLQFEDLIK